MDDYLNEQEQWDTVRTWLRQNGVWLVAGVMLAAIGVWGWRAWQSHRETLLLQADAQFEQLVAAFGKNDLSAVTALADQLSKDHPGTGYAEQGQLAAARLQVENKQLPAAIDRMRKVLASTGDAELALVIRLRIARAQLELQQADEALATLGAAPQPGAFAGRFAELRGDALFAKGDRAGALQAYSGAQAANAGSASGDLLALKINSVASAKAAP